MLRRMYDFARQDDRTVEVCRNWNNHGYCSDRGCPRAHVCSFCNGSHQPGQPLGPGLPACTRQQRRGLEGVLVCHDAGRDCVSGSRSAFATEATTAAAQTGAARVHTSAALQRLPRHVISSQRAKDGWRNRVDEHIASPHQSAPRRAAHVAIRKPPGRTANPASLSPFALQVALGGVREGMAALATAAAAHLAPNNR